MELTWADRLDRVEKTGHFGVDDVADANCWFNCAVGEKVDFHSPDNYISDLTFEAVQLGHKFGCYVHDDDVKNAKRIYKKIIGLESALK